MLSFPNCKINIGLNIVQKRSDGFHDLETIFYPVPFYDVLEIIRDNDAQTGNHYTFTTSGIAINTENENNICIKAYNLVINYIQSLPSLKVHLHKNIPTGAGLGGGSADGAFMLRMLNEKFELGMSTEQLMDLALQLGSDCPFFIKNTSCYAEGRGEKMTPIALDLSGYCIVLVNPGIHISTAKAFSLVQPRKPANNLRQLIQLPVKDWKDAVINDFEKPVMQLYHAIDHVKKSLYTHGALYASMTGSGSTVFGLFSKNVAISFSENYFVKKILL